jgi:hypothetical protein
MRRTLVVLMVCVMSVVLQAQETSTTAAQKAAEAWVGLIDKGDYAASYDEASSMFKAAVSKEDWGKKVKPVREPLGNVLSRKVHSAEYTTSLPGAPDGQYVVLKFDTSYQNKKSAVETAVLTLDKDGQWRVAGYFIR